MLFLNLLLPAFVAGAVLQQRQFGGGVSKVQKLEPKYRKTANRNRYLVGQHQRFAWNKTESVHVEAKVEQGGSGDSTLGGQAIFFRMPKTLCNSQGACTILAAQTGVVYADGKEANPSNGIYIHHILTSDSTKKQSPWLSNCGNPSRAAVNIAGILGGTAFVGTGEDSADGGALYTSEDGTRNSGYHVGPSDSFTGWAQLVNYNKEAKQIYVFYDLEWVPGIQGNDVKTATFTSTCGGSPLIRLSNAGPTNTTSGKFYFMEDGTVLGARGHLHDGGVKVAMFINDKFMCSSDAVYGSRTGSGAEMGGATMGGHSHGASGSGMGAKEGAGSIKTISSMTTCKSAPFQVKKGDTMKLIAQYDLSKHPLRESANGAKASDVMGMLGVSFAAKKI